MTDIDDTTGPARRPGRTRRQVLRPALALAAAAALPATAVPARAHAAPPGGHGQHRGGKQHKGVRVLEEKRSGRLVDLTFDSPSMGGPAHLRLLTPDRPRRGGGPWPVLWMLPGGDGDHRALLRRYRLDSRAELRDVLVVMAWMPVFGFYSDWWNGGRGGPPAVASYHLGEVLPFVEREYGAGPLRVVAGESMGGFGALSYTARYPGLFRAAASYSGYVHPLRHPRAVRAGATHVGLDWLALWGDPVEQRGNWQAHDPYHLAERLVGVPVHLSAGDGRAGPLNPPDAKPDPVVPGLEDPAHPFPEDVLSPTEALMREETRLLARRLVGHGAPVTTHFHSGTHDPVYWAREFDRTLPGLLRHLG